jgi:two-component system sensor histidine kinase MprB
VFDRFYRGATARGRPGSGLGLAIVRQVAETHGGSIAVHEGAGGGSRFVLKLPTLAHAGSEQDDPPAEDMSVAGGPAGSSTLRP